MKTFIKKTSVLCYRCASYGYCAQYNVPVVTDAELANSAFLRDVKATAFDLNIKASDWLESVYSFYRDCLARLFDPKSGAEVFLDMEEFEVPHIREWFRDWVCTPVADDNQLYAHPSSKERVRALATILRARFPEKALMWGVRSANDN